MPLADFVPLYPIGQQGLSKPKDLSRLDYANSIAKWYSFETFLDADVRMTLIKLLIHGKQLLLNYIGELQKS